KIRTTLLIKLLSTQLCACTFPNSVSFSLHILSRESRRVLAPVQRQQARRHTLAPRSARPCNCALGHSTAGRWLAHLSLSESQARKPPHAWEESPCLYGHDPASSGLQSSDIPSDVPAHGRGSPRLSESCHTWSFGAA